MKKEQFDKEFDKVKKYLTDKFIITDVTLKAILAAKENGYPLLLVGPTGCGKTLLLSLLADYWGGTYDYASLNGSVTIHDLTQERVLGKNGEFIEKDMVLARWLRNAEKGISILHLDEVNAARPETLLALHPIMDIKGELVLPYSEEVLMVTDKALLVMSANEGDEYVGINAMNAAFQNRYVKLHIPFIQGSVLAGWLTSKTDVPKEVTSKIVETWEKYMASKDVEQPVVSIRVLERWCELCKYLGVRGAGLATFGSLIANNNEELAIIEHGDFFVNLP